MKMKCFSRVGVAAVSLLTLVACGGGAGGGTTGAGGATGTGSTSDTGSTSGTGGTAGTGGAMGTGGAAAVTCASLLTSDLAGWSESYAADNTDAAALYACVCSAGNPCSLSCDDPAHPSFCAGMAPVTGGMCETCIKQTTGADGCADQYNACQAN